MTIANVETVCRNCGASESTLIHSQVRDADKFGTWSPVVVRCTGCDTVRLSPTESPDEHSFYREDQQLSNALGPSIDWDDYARRTNQDAVRRATLASAHVGEIKDPRILEIGSGYGAFLSQMQTKYPNTVGVEPGRDRVRACKSFGLNAIEGFFGEHDFGTQSFDLICAFHVLEHIVEPLDFLASVRRHLAPGGIFLVEVPNFDDLMNQLSDAYRQFHFQGAHKYYFEARTLERILSHSFESVEIQYEQRYSIRNHHNWLAHESPQLAEPARIGASAADQAYSDVLRLAGCTDTLIGIARA